MLWGDLNDHGESTAPILFHVIVCRVVWDVAMEQPFTWLTSSPDHIRPIGALKDSSIDYATKTHLDGNPSLCQSWA